MESPKSDREQLEDRARKLEELRRLREEKERRKAELPHLYGMPWYQWAWDFFCSRNRYSFLCAANQISKSSTQIRKCIHWATATELWSELWPTTPTQFWYLYPDLGVATVEFEEKWVKEFLPKGSMKDHPVYGWASVMNNKKIHSIRFNSGITVYFKSYEQDVQSLQTSSVYAIFCDEELPVELFPELNSRIIAPTVQGYWSMVFTATLGQEQWRATMEEVGTRHELHRGAFKRQVSMYDCLTYMDGSKSPWTRPLIQQIIDSCASPEEVQRRVFGKFVLDKDRKYASFQRSRNFIAAHKLPKTWLIYSGVDIGSGGTAHPAAIAWLGVKPDFTAGRIFKGWRGDGITTTSGDILDKWVELRGKMKPALSAYDHQAKDFHTIASRRGIPFIGADKSRDSGEQLLNTLFKLGVLKIYDDPELMKLVLELETLKNSTPKPQAKDDFIDAMRFAVTRVPWDFAVINKKSPKKVDEHAALSKRERMRLGLDKPDKDSADATEEELDLANEAMEYGYDIDGGDWYGDGEEEG